MPIKKAQLATALQDIQVLNARNSKVNVLINENFAMDLINKTALHV